MAKKENGNEYNPSIHYEDYDDVGYYIGNSGRMIFSQARKLRNIYHLLYSNENLIRSQYTAGKGKDDRNEVRRFKESFFENMALLYDYLKDETFEPGEYRIKKIYEPKERVIMIAPFFPDRIVHHCIINVIGVHWYHQFIGNTYACIKGRGIHKCMEDVHKALVTDRMGTRYCLKIDIRKFYDNIDHLALKQIIRMTIADEQLLRLLDKIIDSNGKEKGLPIGNFTSQYLANLYLSVFDHWVMEYLGGAVMANFVCRFHYFRYMDDMVFLCQSKEALHYILDMAGLYLGAELKVEIKDNWQIFPVDDRGIDYVGFKQNHYGILLRKGILLKFYRKLSRTCKKYEINDEDDIKHLFPSEYGWIIRCDKEHSDFIFNKCLNYGKKCIDYRTAG